MNIIELLVLLFFAVLAWFHYKSSGRKAAKLPPGPYPLPIIGNIFQLLGQKPHHSLANLSKTYGPLMSLQLGNVRNVVVSSPEIAQEILQKHDHAFPARFNAAATHAYDHHNVSLISLPIGKEWRKLRKICREQLFSSTRLDASQGLRQDSLRRLCDYVQNCCNSGREVDIGQAAFATFLNLMSVTLFSVELSSFDSHEFKEIINGITKHLGAPNIADYFPILAPFDPQRLKRKMEHYFGKLLAVSDDIIQRRLRSRGSSVGYKKENDFLEALLDLGENGLTIKEINHLFMDLLIVGSDTAPSIIEWAMTELLLNPEKLKKAKNELRTVIGENKLVQESDISSLPYLQAVIKEVFRLHPSAPLLVPHRADEDVEVSGYMIPKDINVLFNVWAIGRDPELWLNPNSFEPERFLDGKIDFRGQDFVLIPFGSGRRICPGLPLADRMVSCVVATLVHNFDWKFEVNTAEAAEVHREEAFGLALHKRFPLKAIPIKLGAYESCLPNYV